MHKMRIWKLPHLVCSVYTSCQEPKGEACSSSCNYCIFPLQYKVLLVKNKAIFISDPAMKTVEVAKLLYNCTYLPPLPLFPYY